MRICLLALVPLVLASPAWAQKAIRWNNDVAKAFEAARERDVPVLSYIKGSTGDEDDIEDFERDHRKAFDDPRIIELAQRFICVQMSRSRHRDILKKWRLPDRANLHVVIADGKGDLLDQLSPAEIANVNALGKTMSGAWRRFADALFKEKIEPILAAGDSKPKQLQDALKEIRSGLIVSADPAVRGLLDRAELDAKTRLDALKTIGELSTPDGVKLLLNLTVGGDKDALKALHGATPEGAEHLLDLIGSTETPGLGPAAYAAVCKICRIQGGKPDKFWEGDNATAQQKEIDRVKEAAAKVIERWKEEYADFR
jgi:hypothetical protein